jgi:hypothetical protein
MLAALSAHLASSRACGDIVAAIEDGSSRAIIALDISAPSAQAPAKGYQQKITIVLTIA